MLSWTFYRPYFPPHPPLYTYMPSGISIVSKSLIIQKLGHLEYHRINDHSMTQPKKSISILFQPFFTLSTGPFCSLMSLELGPLGKASTLNSIIDFVFWELRHLVENGVCFGTILQSMETIQISDLIVIWCSHHIELDVWAAAVRPCPVHLKDLELVIISSSLTVQKDDWARRSVGLILKKTSKILYSLFVTIFFELHITVNQTSLLPHTTLPPYVVTPSSRD